MTQALVKNSQSLTAQTAHELNITSSYLQLVKNTFAKGATDDELSLFLRTAQRTGLDPAARQIFMVPRYDSALKSMVKSIQISIDGFRLIADRTGRYAPSREPSFTYENGKLESATAYVKKYVGGEWHEVAATAFYSEYVQTTKEGKANSMWQKMPRLMLAKCAESLVLRRAFPAELSGLYTSDEMGTVETPNQELQKEYEAIHQFNEKVEKGEIKPQVEDSPINKKLSDICAALNKSGDSVNWTKAELADFATTYFDYDPPLPNAFQLPEEEKQALLEELEERLKERSALQTQDVIDAEITEN